MEQDVSVELFDVLGRHVSTLHRGAMPANDTQRFVVQGGGLASGLYIVRIVGEHFGDMRTMLLLK